ncbi:hypothetical protein [Fuscovulum ytuae]|uniref:Uncharacterized protein n=1 Tax=Fuscovulum ytuae TaxID=3042299 RepID=A0ABY8Q5S6_9RHOB|nr:hypothetical protein [Fuscovulum sp. YMD61]WGV15426.1 hypothetical protein QF092_14315 [Fuscovulum sp. YMD61]
MVPGWLVSEDLTKPPYNLPKDAKAVRLHLKAKVAGVTWANNELDGSLQVKLRPHGSDFELNEVLHSATGKSAGAARYTPYDLNHIEVDVPIGEGNRIEIFQEAAIVGFYMQIDLVAYIAGYWR